MEHQLGNVLVQFSPIAASAILSVILVLFRFRFSNKKEKPIDEETCQNFEAVQKWMEDERRFLSNGLQLKDVAKAVKSSSREVSTCINECAGENFNSYINRLRIKEAKKRLTDSGYDHWTVDAIGESVGFSNKVSFYKSFKKIEGCSPNEYKKAIRQQKNA